MTAEIRYIVASGTGYLIDLAHGAPHLHSDYVDPSVRRFDTFGEAQEAADQVERLGFAAEVVQLNIVRRFPEIDIQIKANTEPAIAGLERASSAMTPTDLYTRLALSEDEDERALATCLTRAALLLAVALFAGIALAVLVAVAGGAG